MQAIDLMGYAASALVFLTFCMKDMVPLRAAALCSNVCFLGYGLSLELGPVVALHAALIPINLWRLWQATSCGNELRRCLPHRWLQCFMGRMTRSRTSLGAPPREAADPTPARPSSRVRHAQEHRRRDDREASFGVPREHDRHDAVDGNDERAADRRCCAAMNGGHMATGMPPRHGIPVQALRR
jgi:hypothetical protein